MAGTVKVGIFDTKHAVVMTALQMLVTSEHNNVQPTMMSSIRGIFMSGSPCIMTLLHHVP